MKDTLEALSTTDKYIDLFQQNKEQISNGDPQFMKELRRAGHPVLRTNRIPSAKTGTI